MLKTCKWCGKEFEVVRGKYCSPECYTEGRREAARQHYQKTQDIKAQKRKGISPLLIELSKKGITYAEYQKAKTLAMIPKIDVGGVNNNSQKNE